MAIGKTVDVEGWGLSVRFPRTSPQITLLGLSHAARVLLKFSGAETRNTFLPIRTNKLRLQDGEASE